MQHEIYVIVDKTTGHFMKKYQWAGYRSSAGRSHVFPDKLNSTKFTPILGRARVFESQSKAEQAVPYWNEEVGGWLSNSLVEIVKLTCTR